jgi:anti-sigma B factor antagonist
MDIKKTHHASGSTVELTGELTIYTVNEAKTTLFTDCENYIDPVRLDLSNVVEIDTAGVQLLLFYKKVLTDENKHIQLKSINDTVSNVFNNLSINSQFPLNP